MGRCYRQCGSVMIRNLGESGMVFDFAARLLRIIMCNEERERVVSKKMIMLQKRRIK